MEELSRRKRGVSVVRREITTGASGLQREKLKLKVNILATIVGTEWLGDGTDRHPSYSG